MKNTRDMQHDNQCVYKIFLSFCLIVFSKSNQVQCQNSNLIFDRLTFYDGFTTGICSNIYQDKQGFIWFGTYSGLARYDGYEFKVFNPIQNDSNSISGPYTNEMEEDKRGRLWIGTNYGLNVYDRSSGKFYRFLHDPHNSFSLNDNYIKIVFYEEASDKLWIGTNMGLHSLDLKNLDITQPHKAKFKRYLNKPDDPFTIDNNTIRDVIKDNSNRIFVLTNGNFLNVFDKDKDKFKRIFLHDKVNNTYKMSVIDHKNIMWISTASGYLIKCNLNSFDVQLLEPLKNTKFNPCPLRRLLATNDDRLWITTEGAGLLIYNTKTGEINNCINNLINPSSISSNKLLSILQDQSGIIWIGTNGSEINKYVPNKTKFGFYYPDGKNGLNGKLIRSIIQSRNGDMWIGIDGDGLHKFDRQTNTFIQYKIDPQNQNVFGSKNVFSMVEDHEGIIWIGTLRGGLYKFDVSSNKFTNYKNNPQNTHSIQNDETRCIIEDKKYNLWVGTTFAGLAIFDRKNGYFYHFINNLSNLNSISSNRVTSLFISSNNRLFVGTSSGCDMVDLSNVDFSTYPPSLIFHHLSFVNTKYDINNIYEDSNNNIWFCSGGGGLTKWDPGTGKSFNYNINDGLPSDNITAILEDNQKKFWISSKNGLSKFDPTTKIFKNYNIFDGIQSPEFFNGCCKTKDGQLFFGGVNGFNAFYPNQIKTNLHKPTVILSDLKIFNQSVKIGEKINNHIILKQALSESKVIELSYKENYFSIEFVGLDYVNTHKNKYAFQMLGLDDKWIQLNNKHEATFSNLDPKEYIFKAKAANNDGIWNENGASIKIIILPPWWKTTLFKLFVMIFLITSIYIAYYLRIKNYRKKEKVLTVLVRQRTQEISQANEILLERQTRIEEYTDELHNQTENLRESNNLLLDKQKLIESQADQLKQTNQQLNETNQKLSVLNSTKDRFFSIIAHDLRNPFHTVSGFTELLLSGYKKLPPEKIERYLHLIHTSSMSGNNLLENLLQWSRSQTGRITYDPANINLYTIVEEVVNLLDGEALSKDITLQPQIEEKLTVLADENMVKTIFRNLISNAIKFTPKNGLVIIKAISGKTQVEVTVEDTGVGISADTIPLLFQIENTVTTKGTDNEHGTGLGLLLCKEFIEKHNGKIWVESEVGKGSKFIFTLPLG